MYCTNVLRTRSHVKIHRYPWGGFPDALIIAPETDVRTHARYEAAKSGDGDAAVELVDAYLESYDLTALREMAGGNQPVLVSAHAEEAMGRNAIPQALAASLGGLLGWPVDDNVVQINIVNHTKASGFDRLARPAGFAGDLPAPSRCILVDDFIGQGGTLANLRGHLIEAGSTPIGAIVLTGKPFSAKIALDEMRLEALRNKHGDLETDWRECFGYGFDCLTESEARYLENTPDAQRIRDRILAPAQG